MPTQPAISPSSGTPTTTASSCCCLERIEPEFTPPTWQAFRRWVVEGMDPEQVAAELGTSLTAVYNAKFRVMKRLRQVAQDFCV